MLDTSGLIQLNNVVSIARVQDVFQAVGRCGCSQIRDCNENECFGDQHGFYLEMSQKIINAIILKGREGCDISTKRREK